MVQETFGKVFNEGTEFQRDGSQFDRLFRDGDTYTIGTLDGAGDAHPGHTPACTTHVIGDAAFVGDTLFMPDSGTARADFPGGDAHALYRSVRRILELAPETAALHVPRLWRRGQGCALGDDGCRGAGAQHSCPRRHRREQFVAMRTARDAKLSMPHLIIPSLQVNMKAGHLPAADETGKRFLKVPLDTL